MNGLAVAFVFTSYLVGSVNFARMAGSRHGVDLRDVGSGNLGATNVGRVLGKRIGRLVMTADVAKGLIPAIAAHRLYGASSGWTCAIGIAAVVGHIWPIWLRFRGGKGVATSVGVLLGTVPIAGVVAILGYGLAKSWSRRASIGSLAGIAAGALTVWVAKPQPGAEGLLALTLFALVTLGHRSNIRRIWQGIEPPT